MVVMISTLILSLIIFNYLITDSAADNSTKYLDNYRGEHFPPKYLVPDDLTPTTDDINLYLRSLELLLGYCLNKPNDTDVNQGLGLFYTKVLLKRSLQDYGYKIGNVVRAKIKTLIAAADYVNTHYIYKNTPYGWDDVEFRVSRILNEDEAQVYSIEPFNRHRLIKWLLGKTNFNTFGKDMDTLAFPKEKYVRLLCFREGYHIKISVSDYCLSKIVYNPIPIVLQQMRPCIYNRKCDEAIHGTPSVGYGLSHKLLNLMLLHHVPRCYVRSPDGDRAEMDNMCAFMYREAVYLARSGFFARDLFLEHVALCGMLGYEEFHRRNWFLKVAGWVDDEGCISETRNLQVNRTAIITELLNNSKSKAAKKKQRLARKMQLQQIFEYCHTHPMALLKVVLAHGIRYALHNLPVNTE